jgi:hypothetical protein
MAVCSEVVDSQDAKRTRPTVGFPDEYLWRKGKGQEMLVVNVDFSCR